MKRNVFKKGLALLLLLLFCGCSAPESSSQSVPLQNAEPEEITVSDGGYVARQGKWIYYINGDNFTRETERFHEYAGALCRMNQDGGEKDVVVNADVTAFSIVGEHIFMAVYENGSYIASALVDGTGYEKIKKIDDIYHGGCYAYLDGYFYYTLDYKLRRIDVNGENDKQITNFPIYNLRAANGYVFFTREDDEKIGSVYKLINGETDFVQITKSAAYVLHIDTQCMYYYMLANGYVYKYSLSDGKSTAEVFGGYEEYVFTPEFIGVSYGESNSENEPALYIIDEKGKRLLAEHAAARMTFYNGNIYYINKSSLSQLFCAAIDGSGSKRLCDEYLLDLDTLDIVDNMLYFISDSDEGRIYRLNCDTSKIECISYEAISVVG